MTAAPLKIRLIGSFQASLAGKSVNFPTRTSRLIIGYLALSPGMREQRSRLAGLLWENSDEAGARRNLRQAVHQLRAVLGQSWPGLLADRMTIGLSANLIQTDVDDLITALAAGEIPQALTLEQQLPDRLLGDFADRGDLAAGWVTLQQSQFETTLRSGLERLMGGSDPKTVAAAAQALLALDATDERAARTLIEQCWEHGETGRALRIYKNLWDHLDDAYGMEPSGPTQDLIALVKMGKPNSARPQLASSPAMSVAVVPVVGSNTGDHHAAIEMFRIDLISQMARFRELVVMDAQSAAARADFTLRLGAAHDGENLRLVANLIRTDDAAVIWTRTHDDLLQTWWQSLANLAGHMATACAQELSASRLARITARTSDATVLDKWLIGHRLLDRGTATDFADAERIFKSALEIDPNASAIHSSLSQMCHIRHLMLPGTTIEPNRLREGKAFASKAIALDPVDSRAHLSRAWSAILLGEWGQAANGFETARNCNPNDTWTVMSSALGAAFSGELVLANDLARNFVSDGQSADRWLWGYYANIRFLTGDDDGCIEAALMCEDAIMNMQGWLAVAYWLKGDHDSAIAAWGRFIDIAERHWSGIAPPSPESILEWFLNAFPIRMGDARARLSSGARAVGDAYLHCVQE